MKKKTTNAWLLRFAPVVLSLTIFSNAARSQEAVGIFDNHSDVGTGVKPGSANFIPATGQYVISGAGYNVWADHDEFQYVYKKMKGDFILYTRAEFLGDWVSYHRKVGWMVRKSLDGNSPHVNAVVHGDGLTSLQFRRAAGAQTEEHMVKNDACQYPPARKKRQSIYHARGDLWRTLPDGYDRQYRPGGRSICRSFCRVA